MCVTDRHDMTLAVKVVLNLQHNQPTNHGCNYGKDRKKCSQKG